MQTTPLLSPPAAIDKQHASALSPNTSSGGRCGRNSLGDLSNTLPSPMAAPSPEKPKKRTMRRWPSGRSGRSSTSSTSSSSMFGRVSSLSSEASSVGLDFGQPKTAEDGEGFLRRLSSTSHTSAEDCSPAVVRPKSRQIARRNSITETKTIFMRGNVRSASFTEPTTFSFESHFEWLEKLGSECYPIRPYATSSYPY